MNKILIVDDDVSIGNMLEEMLIKEDYAVLRAYSGTEALLLLREDRPDLVLLDLMLPGLSGEEVLPYLREVPVLVVSARTDVEDKVELLLGGAVDYVTKPFSGKELLARIAVQIRKKKQEQSAVQSENNEVKSILNYGEIRLNTGDFQCFVDGQDVRLTRTEFAILKILMTNPTQIIPRSVMLEHISMDSPDCTESSLKVHVSHLRGKLRKITGKDYIEAIWGIGFRLRTDL